jgi:hypothetical protein
MAATISSDSERTKGGGGSGSKPVIWRSWIRPQLEFAIIVMFAIGVQFDVAEARELGSLTVAGPLLALAWAFGARLCLKRAFPEDIRR